MTTVAEFVIGGLTDPWTAIGIHFSSDGRANLGNTWLHCDTRLPPGLYSWVLSDAPRDIPSIDGLVTTYVDDVPALNVENISEVTNGFQLQIAGVDHVVVNTPDLQRTSDALANATGAPLKRVRDVGNGAQQGFHRLGGVIVEIVSTPQTLVGPAVFWGLVFVVDDLEAVFNHVGPDVLSPPKPAVQPGRNIATFRSAAQLGVPCALMTR
ncbi:MAG: VOC family protein [Ilumatobacteraceae bacterium]